MRETTNGIGVESLAIGRQRVCLVGNRQLHEWAPRLKLCKIVVDDPTLNVLTFVFRPTSDGTKLHEQGRGYMWTAAYSGKMPESMFPFQFGATTPRKIRLAEDDRGGLCLEVTMPPRAKCAELRRYTRKEAAHKPTPAVQEQAIPLEQPIVQAPDPVGLLAAVRQLNQLKDTMGDELWFVIGEDGKLTARVYKEYV